MILVQPILGMLFAVPVLGEAVDAVTAVFGVAIIATVFAGVFFGVSMALIYALRKRRLQLADWQTVTTASA